MRHRERRTSRSAGQTIRLNSSNLALFRRPVSWVSARQSTISGSWVVVVIISGHAQRSATLFISSGLFTFYAHLFSHRIFPIYWPVTSFIVDRLIDDKLFCRSLRDIMCLWRSCLLSSCHFHFHFYDRAMELPMMTQWILIKPRIKNTYLMRLSALFLGEQSFISTHMPYFSSNILTGYESGYVLVYSAHIS